MLLNHSFRLRYLILSVSNSNFNLFNLIFGLILPVGYLKTIPMAEHIYNVYIYKNVNVYVVVVVVGVKATADPGGSLLRFLNKSLRK